MTEYALVNALGTYGGPGRKLLKQIAEITGPIRDRQICYRPDGSITNW